MTGCENEITTEMNGKAMTVHLEGDIDHHNARAVRSRIDTIIFVKRPEVVRLDLSHVSFMDSSGLGLILGRYTKAVELGIGFKLANPTAQIKRILDLAGIERIIGVEYDRRPMMRE